MQENNQRLAKNTLLLYFRMLLTMGVSLYTSRIVLDVMGIDDYGLYNVIGGAVGLFTFFSASMQSATQRFLSFEIGRNQKDKYNQVFNCNVILYLAIAIIILFFSETIGLWYVNNKLNVPIGREGVVNIVYQLSIYAMIIAILRIPYAAGIISQEKMSFFAYTSILESVLKLLMVYILAKSNFDKLILYCFLILILTLIVNVIYFVYCTKDKNSLYKLTFCRDKKIYISLLSFTGWRFLGASAQITEKEGVNLLLNSFFNVAINAANGIAWQVNIAVSSLVSSFQQAYQPQITKYYANDEKTYLKLIVLTSAKFSFILLSFFVLPFILNMEFILEIWLKEVPLFTAEFCNLILISTLIDTFSAPLWMLILATGKISKYQIYLSIIIISSFLFEYLFLTFGYSPSSVLYVRIVCAIVILFYRILLLKYYYRISIDSFINNIVLKSTMLFTITTLFIYFIINPYHGIIKLAFSILLEALIYPLLIYFLLFNQKEKGFIKNFLTTILIKLKFPYVK